MALSGLLASIWMEGWPQLHKNSDQFRVEYVLIPIFYISEFYGCGNTPLETETIHESESRSVVSNSLQPQGLYRPWNSPGQNTGVDSRSFLQGIFPTQGLNPGFPHCRQILYQLSHQGNPHGCKQSFYFFSPCHIASCISQTLLQLGRHIWLRSDQRNKYRGHILLIGMTCSHRILVCSLFCPLFIVCVLVTQLCLTLCNHIECSLPGSSVHGILWPRILKWVAIPFLVFWFKRKHPAESSESIGMAKV